MRHRTALPFLDAFLKPTKHILLVYSFIIVYVISAKKKNRVELNHVAPPEYSGCSPAELYSSL